MKLAVLVIAIGLVGCGTNKVDARMQAEREAWRKQAEEQEAQRTARRQAFEARKAKCNGLSQIERIVTGVEAQQVQESVKDSLKDPWSAYFKNIREVSKFEQCIDNARESGGYTVYRGLVNSKNSYGGYAGWSKFNIYNNKTVDIYGI